MDIQPFNGEYSELSDLINRSWHNEHSSHIDFSPDYLQHVFESQGMMRDLTLCAYHKGKLICFALSAHRDVIIKHKPYKGLLTTLATTDPEYASLFPYLKLKAKWQEAALALQYDLNFGYAAYGIQNNEIEQFYAKKKKYQCALVNQFGSLSCLSQDVRNIASEHPVGNIKVKDLTSQDSDDCLRLITEAMRSCTVYQQWRQGEFEAMMRQTRYGKGKVIVRDHTVVGFVGYKTVQMKKLSGLTLTCFIYHLFLDGLTEDEKIVALGSIFDEIVRQGVEVINIPNCGYFGCADLLKQLGFREARLPMSKTNLYITLFAETVDFTATEPFYLDII